MIVPPGFFKREPSHVFSLTIRIIATVAMWALAINLFMMYWLFEKGVDQVKEVAKSAQNVSRAVLHQQAQQSWGLQFNSMEKVLFYGAGAGLIILSILLLMRSTEKARSLKPVTYVIIPIILLLGLVEGYWRYYEISIPLQPSVLNVFLIIVAAWVFIKKRIEENCKKGK